MSTMILIVAALVIGWLFMKMMGGLIKKLIVIGVLIGVVFMLAGCYSAPTPIKPISYLFTHMPKDAPPMYQRGWKDGCNSGLAQMSNGVYRTFYTFTFDTNLAKDPVYYRTWQDAKHYCLTHSYGMQVEGDVRMRLPTERFKETFLGSSGFFDKGALNFWGPGNNGVLINSGSQVPFADARTAGGDVGFFETNGGTIDFSGDAVFAGKEQGLRFPFSDSFSE